MGDDAERVVVYSRISEDDLGLEKGIARQTGDGRTMAVARGWRVVAELSDNDLSAFKGAPRPGYEKLLDLVRAGEVDRVVVFHTSRLWRNRRERAEGIEIFGAARVSVSAVKGPELDFSSAYGRGVADLMGSVDTMESDIKSERVAREALGRAREGRANGRVAFGWARVYEHDSQGRVTGFQDVEHPEQAAIVREIVKRLLAGDTLIAITADLNARGVPAPGAGMNRKRRAKAQDADGTRWNKTSVKKIATREMNIAIRRHGADRYPAAWPALVSEGDHARINAMFAARAVTGESPGQRKHLLTWGEVGTCGVCGSWLRVGVRGNQKHGTKQELYLCDDKEHVGRNREAVDAYTRDLVIARLGRADALDLFATPDDDAVPRVLDEIAGLRAKLDEAAEDYANDEITREQRNRITENVRAKIEAAQRRLRLLQPAVNVDAVAELAHPDPDVVARRWDGLDVVRQRQALEALGFRLEIHRVTRRGPGFDRDSIKFPDGRPFGHR